MCTQRTVDRTIALPHSVVRLHHLTVHSACALFSQADDHLHGSSACTIRGDIRPYTDMRPIWTHSRTHARTLTKIHTRAQEQALALERTHALLAVPAEGVQPASRTSVYELRTGSPCAGVELTDFSLACAFLPVGSRVVTTDKLLVSEGERG
eukprot:6184409-Pleurochrysis_carterae.AAC.1